MPTEQLEKLDDAQKARCQDFVSWWSSVWLTTESSDEEAISQALARVYARLGRKAPHVIWCDSPWQLSIAPFLLKLLCFQPNEAQRRLLRRSYDRTELKRTIRLELTRNLNEELWARALDALVSQLQPEIEYAVAHEASPDRQTPLIGIERALGLHIESVVHHAHSHLRHFLSLNIIEELVRELTSASLPMLRAKITLDQEFALRLGRPSCDFNGGIRGGGARLPRAGAARLVSEFVRQMGQEFSTHMARLLTADYIPLPEANADRNYPLLSDMLMQPGLTAKAWQDAKADARLAHAITDYALTWGRWSQDFMRIYMFALHVFDNPPYPQETQQQLGDLVTLRMGAFMYVFGERVVFACKHPLAIRLDQSNRLHSYSLPAVEFLDGHCTYCWSGVVVPQQLVDCPESLTPRLIEQEPNVERRRVLLERYGLPQFLLDSGATLISYDDCGSLFVKPMPGDEPLVMVRVTNSTPEPDGTYKDYFLRVPPTIKTAREAVAWTFNMAQEEYRPQVQT